MVAGSANEKIMRGELTAQYFRTEKQAAAKAKADKFDNDDEDDAGNWQAAKTRPRTLIKGCGYRNKSFSASDFVISPQRRRRGVARDNSLISS